MLLEAHDAIRLSQLLASLGGVVVSNCLLQQLPTLGCCSDFLLTDLTSQLCPESVGRLERRCAVDCRNAGGGDAALPHLEPLWAALWR